MGAPATSVRTRPAPKRGQRPGGKGGGTASTPSRRSAGPQGRPRAGARSAPRRSAARSSRSRITPPGGVAMIPVHAVGGAAGAVGGLADSGVVVGLTRGRLWIAVLGLLLGGIVALNVWGLSMSASTSGVAAKIDELERRNSVLAATAAKRQSSDRIQRAADRIGLVTPTPKAITHLKARSADARRAAERLAAGEIGALDGLVVPEFAAVAGAAVAPEAAPAEVQPPVAETVTPVAPVAPEPVAESPTPVEPAPLDPEPPAPTPAPPPGGGVAP